MLSFMKDHRNGPTLEILCEDHVVRTSFRFYANGPRALGKTRKHADVSKLR
jgi:hypothetical protein